MVRILRRLVAPFLLVLILSVLPGTSAIPLAVRAQSSTAQGPGKVLYLPVVMGLQLGSGNLPPAPTATVLPSVTPTPTATLIPTKTPRPTPTPTSAPGQTAILLAAGDIARCGSPGSSQTAAIINKNSGTVAALGDNAYESGLITEFQNCYDPAWGAFKNRTMPVPGNHEYLDPGASGYFTYFGTRAGNPSQGYYSYDLGTWHILALNSSCGQAGGCSAGSPQEKFVKSELAAHPNQCVLAYWHHPYYSSGEWGNISATHDIVQDLYNAKAEIILSGHDHDYERFAPQDPNGNLDAASGFVQFVVGTGGSNNTPWTTIQPNSLVRQNSAFGVLKLTLKANSYDWQFIPVSGSFRDSGTASCH